MWPFNKKQTDYERFWHTVVKVFAQSDKEREAFLERLLAEVQSIGASQEEPWTELLPIFECTYAVFKTQYDNSKEVK